MTTATPTISPEEFLAKCGNYLKDDATIDVVGSARLILEKHCNGNAQLLANFDKEPNVQQASQFNTAIQLHKLNLFLNSQYSCLRGDISVHRGFIVRDQNVENWLKMFDTYHAPTMVSLGLPVDYATLVQQ